MANQKSTENTKGPEFIEYFGPLLDALRDLNGSGTPKEVTDIIATNLNLPESVTGPKVSSGVSRFENQVAWARLYLVRAGFLDPSERGKWRLTERGKEKVLSLNEALEIYRKYRNEGAAFEDLVAGLFRANNFDVTNTNPQSRFDFVATLANDRWAVEVKYYRTKQAQLSLIEKAATALLESAKAENFTKAMLVVSSYLNPELRKSVENEFKIIIIDRIDLSIWSNQAPDLVDSLAALLGEAPSSGGIKKARIDPKVSFASTVARPPITNEGADLCRELRALGKGKKHWKEYESLCERILRYLFPNDLSGWHAQKRTDDGLNRYDLICRLSPTTDFWRFVDSQLASSYVLFEFKNYNAPIKQGQVLTTEKYLLTLALRRLGIILSRKGADKSAQMTVAGAMREAGKMMLILDDDYVCELLHAKDRGDDPSDYLFQLTDDFLMALNR
jgi:hypothetical protein